MMTRLGVVLATLMVPVVVLAQPGPPGTDPADRPFARIEHWKKVRLIEMLDLTEEQSIRFLARLNEHEKARREMVKEKESVLDKIERLVRNRADEAEIEKLFPDVAEADRRLIEEQKKFHEGLAGILSASQRGRMLLFERRFDQELREAMREVYRRRGRVDRP